MVKKLKRPKAQSVMRCQHSGSGRRPVHFWAVNESPAAADGEARAPIMEWARILAYVKGTVDQELLARNEYPAAENRMLKA
jgi:hypothetical protein